MLARFLILMALLGWAAPVSAEMDVEAVWDQYSEILDRHTKETKDLAQIRVDYPALRQAPAWSALIQAVGKTDPKKLSTRTQQLAYWSNVYNIFAIDVVVKGNPKESIRDLGGTIFNQVWDHPAGVVAGRTYTLSQIEHEILRPLGDPRIHGAIVCASYSCPPLARKPYRVATLDEDLTANLERWLAHPAKGLRVERASKTIYLSSIFDWFEEDFGGERKAIAFSGRYAPEGDRGWIQQNAGSLSVEYLAYDWSLNRY